jgi:hypothetical protein
MNFKKRYTSPFLCVTEFNYSSKIKGVVMYLIREIMNTKPGKAKELVAKFKKVMPYMEKDGVQNTRIMTDAVGDYWTVVVQFEVNDLGEFFKGLRGATTEEQEMQEIMKGYMDLVNGGRREIYLIE